MKFEREDLLEILEVNNFILDMVEDDIATLDAAEALEDELNELMESVYSFSILGDGKKGIAIVALQKEFDGDIEMGHSYCDPDDEFDPTVGLLIAFKRALGHKFDASQYGKEKETYSCETCRHAEASSFAKECIECKEDEKGNWSAI